MTAAGPVAAVVVGAAFILAGAAKLAAGEMWPQQARDLGAPRWSITVLPWIELILGALLIVQVARRLAAAAALVVLLAFTALIGIRLSQGRRPPCACFGAWSSKPLGAGHLVRNAVLMAVGTVALVA